MSDTLEQSVRSVLDQLDDRFEVLVVDDGSTDGSVEILERLQAEYDALRVIALPRDPHRRLGETRNISVREARGEHVVLHLDTDEYYEPGIRELVEVYRQLRSELDFDFYLNGSVVVAPRAFLLDRGPYRNLPIGGEHLDLYRRLLAEETILFCKHQPFWREIGYTREQKSILERVRRNMLVKLSDARSGLDFWSCLRWGLSAHSSPIKRLYEVIAYTIAYLIATRGESYPVPDEFQKKGAVPQAIVERQRTLAEIEEAYDITIDRDALSERGRELFYGDITDISYREYREQSATTGGDE